MSLVCPSSAHAPRSRRGHALRSLLARLCLVLGIGAATLAALPSAHAAAAVGCRADPVLWVTVASTNNAYKVQLTATTNAASSDVRGVVYTVHAPTGTVLSSVGYTGGAFMSKEAVQFVADTAPGTFTVTTTLTTSTHVHDVTVAETVSHPGFNRGAPTTQASGTDGQGIATSVSES